MCELLIRKRAKYFSVQHFLYVFLQSLYVSQLLIFENLRLDTNHYNTCFRCYPKWISAFCFLRLSSKTKLGVEKKAVQDKRRLLGKEIR